MQKPLTNLIVAIQSTLLWNLPPFIQNIPQIGSRREPVPYETNARAFRQLRICHWRRLSIPMNLADDRKASCSFSSRVKSKMLVYCCICQRKLADYDNAPFFIWGTLQIQDHSRQLRLWLVARLDRSWFCRPVLDLQCGPEESAIFSMENQRF